MHKIKKIMATSKEKIIGLVKSAYLKTVLMSKDKLKEHITNGEHPVSIIIDKIDVEHIDDTRSKMVLHYDDYDIKTIITWAPTSFPIGSYRLDNIEIEE